MLLSPIIAHRRNDVSRYQNNIRRGYAWIWACACVYMNEYGIWPSIPDLDGKLLPLLLMPCCCHSGQDQMSRDSQWHHWTPVNHVDPSCSHSEEYYQPPRLTTSILLSCCFYCHITAATVRFCYLVIAAAVPTLYCRTELYRPTSILSSYLGQYFETGFTLVSTIMKYWIVPNKRSCALSSFPQHTPKFRGNTGENGWKMSKIGWKTYILFHLAA